MTEDRLMGTEGVELRTDEVSQARTPLRFVTFSDCLGSASGCLSQVAETRINSTFSVYCAFLRSWSEAFGRSGTMIRQERSRVHQLTMNYRMSLHSVPRISPRTGQTGSAVSDISVLKWFYPFREERTVTEFLAENPTLVQILFEAYDHATKHFPEPNELSLDVVSDPEALGDEELVVFIQSKLSPDEALKSLERFEEDWWLDNCRLACGKLCFHVEFD